MSFSPFNGRTLTTVEAGLALNVTSSLVKGLMPLRALVAGLRTLLILSRPGSTNSPAPFFLDDPPHEDGKAPNEPNRCCQSVTGIPDESLTFGMEPIAN